MEIETVETTARPMLFVTRDTSMEPTEIARAMGEAFAALGSFLGETGVAPAGPPVAVYRDWRDGKMSIDVGMPVAPADQARAAGEVKAGHTPACKAMKTVHRGPYDRLRDTYAAVIAEMNKAGLPTPPFAWEVYLNVPETTPADELLTEIYMPVP